MRTDVHANLKTVGNDIRSGVHPPDREEIRIQSVPVRVVNIDYRSAVFIKEVREQSLLCIEVFFHRFMKIQVVSGKICKDRGAKYGTVYPVLCKGMDDTSEMTCVHPDTSIF